jgi:plastocyanin
MFRRTPLTATLVTLLLVAGACGGTSAATSASKETTSSTVADGPDLSATAFDDATARTEVEVEARDNSFVEQFTQISAGTTVTFTNVGRTEHNVYPVVDGDFAPVDATDLEPGESAAITLDDPVDVAFYCTLHGTTTKGMMGAIRVAP